MGIPVYPSCRHHPIFAEVHSVVRRRQRRRRSLLDSVDTHSERVLGDNAPTTAGPVLIATGCPPAPPSTVRRPEAVGNPLHNVVVEPFERRSSRASI